MYGVEGMAPAIYLRAIPWTLSSRLVLILFSTVLIHTIEQQVRVRLFIAVYIQWHTFGERPHVGPMALLHWKRVPMHFFGYVVDMSVEC